MKSEILVKSKIPRRGLKQSIGKTTRRYVGSWNAELLLYLSKEQEINALTHVLTSEMSHYSAIKQQELVNNYGDTLKFFPTL